MKAFTVEWANVNWIYKYDRAANGEVCTQVVHLHEVDALIQEAVLFAENVTRNGRWQPDEWERARAFLASPLVAAWRERQKGKL